MHKLFALSAFFSFALSPSPCPSLASCRSTGRTTSTLLIASSVATRSLYRLQSLPCLPAPALLPLLLPFSPAWLTAQSFPCATLAMWLIGKMIQSCGTFCHYLDYYIYFGIISTWQDTYTWGVIISGNSWGEWAEREREGECGVTQLTNQKLLFYFWTWLMIVASDIESYYSFNRY